MPASTALQLKVRDAIRTEPIPQTMAELSERAGLARATCSAVVTQLLKTGQIARKEMPWRIDSDEQPTKRGAKQKTFIRGMENLLKKWAKEGGKDRVAAARALIELKSLAVEGSDIPQENDRAGILDALTRMIVSAGRPVSVEAMELAFNSTVTLTPKEAVGEGNTNVAGPAAS